ncbi:YKL050C and EIS1 (YMR031C) [Zygosaccharomyces parabailii]|nr:YKL050C and EIS1 (YMR031C) [Zygosaccharomyces parabailii]CDH16729.1 related to Eisosome protein 1 [Zygosaccharomyces bailii ISA1307]
MSLVSAVTEKEQREVLGSPANGSEVQTVTATRKATTKVAKPGTTTRIVRGYAIYHTGEGAQLSKGALYRAKVKYGIYQSPALARSTGVAEPRVASDAAANHANGNKTTIEAYKRLFVDPNAHKAAARSVVNGGPRVEAVVIPSSHHGSHQAATRAYSTASAASEEKARLAQKPMLPAASRANSLKSAHRAFYHTKVPEQEKIVPKPVGKRPMDMSKVLSSAERRAETRIIQRGEPVRGFNLGIPTNGPNRAAASLLRKPVYKEVEKENVPQASEGVRVAKHDQSMFAQSAAYAVKDMDPHALTNKEFEERARARNLLLTQLTSQQVLAKARENAEKQLAATPYDVHKVLFGNEAYNRAAIEKAQKNAQEGITDVGNQNKINLGGGLWLSPDDVHTIARNLVDPVLGEVHQRADDQRATDLDISDRNDYVTSEWAAWMSMHKTKEHNNQALLTNSKNKRDKEEAEARGEATRNYTELCNTMDQQVSEQTDLVNRTKEAKTILKIDVKEELIQDVQHNKESLDLLKQQHGRELDAAREEQRRLLQPYHDRLSEANLEHERLVQERTAINEAIAKLHESIEVHKENIQKYEKALEAQDEKRSAAQDDLDGLKSDRENLQGHFDDHVVIIANKAKEQATLSTEEARLKNLEIEAIVNERKSELNKTEQDLQREKLNMLEAMQATAEARGDENIDEERVKQLIGMSSTEYIAEQKKLQKKARKAARRARKEAKLKAEQERLMSEGADPENANAVDTANTADVAKIPDNTNTAADNTNAAVDASAAVSAAAAENSTAPEPQDVDGLKSGANHQLSSESNADIQHESKQEADPVTHNVKKHLSNQDGLPAVPQTPDAAELGKPHSSDEDLQELTTGVQEEAKRGGEPQASYFKEVF